MSAGIEKFGRASHFKGGPSAEIRRQVASAKRAAATRMVKRFIGWGYHPTKPNTVIPTMEMETAAQAVEALRRAKLEVAEIETVWRSE